MKGYDAFTHTDERDRSYRVYRRGVGPPVIIIHELAGISPMLTGFAARVVDRGFTVYLPELIRTSTGPLRLAEGTVRVCISAEFVKLAREQTSPIVTWLKSLARRIYEETKEPLGVVGMCLTGGFALAMAVDTRVVAPVMAHPSLPLAIGSRRRADLGLDRGDLTKLLARDDLKILGVRFSADLVSPSPRLDRMEAEFGPRFRRLEVSSGCRSPLRLPWWEHTVLNNPRLRSDKTKDAAARAELEGVVGEVLDFLRVRLKEEAGP